MLSYPPINSVIVSYGTLVSQKKMKRKKNYSYFFVVQDGSRKNVNYFVHTGGQFFFYHTLGQRPSHIAGYDANTVTLGWVGAPNERTQFRIHGAVVGFVD